MKNITITFRIIQAVCLGIFSLGLSLAISDYSVFIKVPISTISITTSVFGLMGAIITEVIARQSENW